MTQLQQQDKSINNLYVRLIMEWLSQQVTTDSFMWLSRKMKRLSIEPTEKLFFLIFNTSPAKIGRKDLLLEEKDLTIAKKYHPHWHPEKWTASEAARIALMLSMSELSNEYIHCVEKIFNDGKEDKLIALYKGLSLFSDPKIHLPFATHAIQFNNKNIIEALIHNNAFPYEYFNDKDWNKLIIHSVSIGCSLKPVIGFKERSNNNLSQSL